MTGQQHPPVDPEFAAGASVDPAEAARFARLAATWWDESGPFWPLHRLNALRVAFISDALCRLRGGDPAEVFPLAGVSVLDIGCGGGILSEAVARLGARVVGIDVAARNVAIARDHAAASGLDIDYRVTTAEALAASGERFEAVLNMEVVEHVADLPLFMEACGALVAPGGAMTVATINRTLAALLTAKLGAEYVLRWLPRGTHQWRRFPRPEELEALLGAAGLRVESRRGVAVNPITRAFRLTDRLHVNYMLLAVRELAAT